MSSKIPPPRPASVFTPFLRRFTDERARDLDETVALYREVRAAHEASNYSHENIVSVVSAVVAERVGEAVELPDSVPLAEALDRCQQEVLGLETTLFTFPEIDWSTEVLSLREQVDLSRFLRAKQHFLANHERVVEVLVDSLADLFGGLIRALPRTGKEGATALFTVPLLSVLEDVGKAVDRIVGTAHDRELAELGLCVELRARLYDNVCRASGVAPDDDKSRKPLIMAVDSDLPPQELVETYLRGTPFLDLFLMPVPFALPDEVRVEHMHVVAGSGHGKTQLLQHLIAHDLQRPAPPSLIVIDSQGEMLRKIQRLAVFADNPDRLVIVDPEQYSPALNMFDTANARAARYSALHREQLQAGIVELYNYIFASIAAEMTSRQSTAFAFVSRLMLAIPGATIHTLRELMEDPASTIEQSRFKDYVPALEPTAQAYFQNQFFTKRYADLRQQIARRLYGVLSVPAFDRMFSAQENRLDMFDAMQSGKVVLVNTSKALLKADASALFGRYMIALVIRAVYERVAAKDRHPTYLVVDEASEYFDDNIQLLLEQARKFNVGLVLAHQHLDQLSVSLRSAISANTAIKLAGGVNDRDARALAPGMRTTGEFISSIRKRRASTEFACYVRNSTESALRLAVPFGTLEGLPRMSAEEERVLVERNRGRYGTWPMETSSAAVPVETPSSPPVPDAPPTEEHADDWRS
ncbi:MAG: type IV secretion system DNA-binding domain-containing protein [Enhydrobacter sp.]|nr:MAG: type IV secretion system DNA-binding domain-containing protein [Enhydrobacter sp.]